MQTLICKIYKIKYEDLVIKAIIYFTGRDVIPGFQEP
jgi:hypothetical protein